MQARSRFATAWRCGVVVFAVLAAVELAIETFHAPRVLRAGVATEQLFTGAMRDRGPTTFVVESMPADSPLHAAGVVVGDGLRYDDPIGRWHNLVAGDKVALTVLHGATERRIEIEMPAAAELPRRRVAEYVMDAASKFAALLIGVLVGWRRPDLIAYRALAASGLLYAFGFPYSAPAAAHIDWLDFIASVSQELVFGAFVLFALNYPDDRPIGWRARLARWFPWLYGLQAVFTIYYYARLYTGSFEPSMSIVSRTASIVLPALFFLAIVLAWRQSRGESRMRLQWIIATIGAIVAISLVGNLNHYAGKPIPEEELGLVLSALGLAAEGVFIYAVLRRRIFDFGLAVNRTLVAAIIGGILLGVFKVVHGFVGDFLHFDDKNKAVLLSAILAVAVYLSFSQLKKLVEKVVDRVFFNSWAVSEEELKTFTEQARHASDPNALSTLMVAALDRYTGRAGCAVFRKDEGSNEYVRTHCTLAGAPDAMSANAETVLAMRAKDKAVVVRDSPAALAVPMARHGEFAGFVLLGPRKDAEPYRKDQVEAIERAVQEVGLDFYALKLDELTRCVAAERATAHTLRAQLATAMELARVPPALPPGES